MKRIREKLQTTTTSVMVPLLCQLPAVAIILAFSTSLHGAANGQPAQYRTLADAAKANNATRFVQVAPELLMNDPAFQGIVFMATDAAFDKAAERLSTFDPADILAYHVVPGNTSYPSLSCANRTTLQTSLSYPTGVATTLITLVPLNASGCYLGGIVPGIKMTSDSTSITASQATVYIVNDLLFPALVNSSSEGYALTLWQAAQADPAFGILTLIVSADQEISELLNDQTAAYTVFAPSNDAFSSALEILNMTALELMPLLGSQLLNSVLKMHFLSGPPMLASDIPVGSISTLNTEYKLDISNDGVTVMISGPGNPVAASVVQADIKAGLSVAHVVDKVLFPPLEDVRAALSALGR